MYTKFFVRPGENELIQTQVTLTPEQHSVLRGCVKASNGRVLDGALVMLFETSSPSEPSSFSAVTLTDSDGEFAFGPLEPGKLHIVKVYKNSIKLRELEVITD